MIKQGSLSCFFKYKSMDNFRVAVRQDTALCFFYDQQKIYKNPVKKAGSPSGDLDECTNFICDEPGFLL